MFNAPRNVPWMEEGIRAHDSGQFSQAPAEDLILDGQPPPQRQEQPSMPNFAAVAQQPASPQPTAGGYQQVAQLGAPGLPQHVIDAGNLLRVNGYEITPRTMYLAHVLGAQGAVDLMKRTGSTGSPPEVPSPDAATGDRMRAWVRASRLGPAAAAIAGGAAAGGLAGARAPAAEIATPMARQSNEDPLTPAQPFA